MAQLKIFDTAFGDLIKGNISSIVVADNSEPSSDTTCEKLEVLQIPQETSKTFSCSYCRVEFTDFSQQRIHYKLDWHRYNLKQNLLGRDIITEEEFVKKSDDVSSISGSDSDEETINDKAKAQGKIFLKTEDGKVFSTYRCLVMEKKDEVDDDVMKARLLSITAKRKWTIIMLGGGHFGGAVFDVDEPILHKTFHSYTVRAGQGGSQSARDNKNAGSAPKSAGASLRRYNEQTFIQHISDILANWQEELSKSSLIFLRAAGPFNRSVLFGGKNPLLNRNDPRIRIIPFSTRRPTFSEVKRIHSTLSHVSLYDSVDIVLKQFSPDNSPEKESKRNKVKHSSINRAKSREITERPLPAALISSSESGDSDEDTSGEEKRSKNERQLEFVSLEIDFREALQSLDDSLTRGQRKRHTKKKKPRQSKAQKTLQRETARKNELLDIIKTGNLDKLVKIFKTYSEESNLDKEKQEVNNYINEVIDDEGNTLLHIAVLSEQSEVVNFLLEEGADVCMKNTKQQTPYSCMKHKSMRDLLKDYAAQNSDKHNYNKAQIPLPNPDVTAEEVIEKKRLQKKAKIEKEKIKKRVMKIREVEQQQRDRFAALSDREKRALAAERRILDQSGVVIARCFLCGEDISGKVPFEYLGNRFCTIDCLKAHRMKNPVKLS